MTDDEMKKQMYQPPKKLLSYAEREEQLHTMPLNDLAALFETLSRSMGLPVHNGVWRDWQQTHLVDSVIKLEAHQGTVVILNCARCSVQLVAGERKYAAQVFCPACYELVAYVHLQSPPTEVHPEQHRACLGFVQVPTATAAIPLRLSGDVNAVTCSACWGTIVNTNMNENYRIERERDREERKKRKALRDVNAKKFGDKPNRMERREELWKMPIAEFIALAIGHSGIRLGSWKNILAPLQTRTLEKDESKRLKGTVKELLHIEPIGVVIEKMVNYETSCAYLEDIDFVCRVCHTKVYGHASRTRSSKKLISRELFIAFAHLRLCVLCATKMMMTDAMQEGVLVGIDKALEDGEVRPKGSG